MSQIFDKGDLRERLEQAARRGNIKHIGAIDAPPRTGTPPTPVTPLGAQSAGVTAVSAAELHVARAAVATAAADLAALRARAAALAAPMSSGWGPVSTQMNALYLARAGGEAGVLAALDAAAAQLQAMADALGATATRYLAVETGVTDETRAVQPAATTQEGTRNA